MSDHSNPEKRIKLLLRVVYAVLLEDFGDDGNCRVHRVRNDKDKGLGCSGRDAGGKVTDDTCVDLGAAGLARRNDAEADVIFYLEQIIPDSHSFQFISSSIS